MQIEAGKTYRAVNGERIGPVKRFHDKRFIRAEGDGFTWNADGSCHSAMLHGDLAKDINEWDLISEWVEGPVRTVTRREIVAGTYGKLEVEPHEQGSVLIGISNPSELILVAFTADEIDTLVQHLTAIAEALRAQ